MATKLRKENPFSRIILQVASDLGLPSPPQADANREPIRYVNVCTQIQAKNLQKVSNIENIESSEYFKLIQKWNTSAKISSIHKSIRHYK